MNDNKQKTANALLSAFPTADPFKAFKEEKISEKTISGLLAVAKMWDFFPKLMPELISHIWKWLNLAKATTQKLERQKIAIYSPVWGMRLQKPLEFIAILDRTIKAIEEVMAHTEYCHSSNLKNIVYCG